MKLWFCLTIKSSEQLINCCCYHLNVILLVPGETRIEQSYGGEKRGALFDKRPELQIVCSIVSLWKCLVHLGRWIKGIKSELEAGQVYCEAIVQTESLLIRQHNDDSSSAISESQQHLCTSFLLLLLCPPHALPLSRFLPVWHFQSAQYPLTEYPLTFGWLDTFSSGREFIIHLHLRGPLSLKHFLEQEKSREQMAKWSESHLLLLHTLQVDVWEQSPSGKSGGESQPSQSGESCSFFKTWVSLAPTISSSVFRSFFASFWLNSSQRNGIFKVRKSPAM